MKMFKKEELEYRNGYIVKNDEIIGVDNKIVDMFNQFEEDIQRAKHEKDNKPAPVEEPKPFYRKTERGSVYPFVQADTPVLDKMTERAINLMDELDSVGAADKINDYFDTIQPIILFADDEFVVSGEQASQHRFDLPTIGNPLKVTKEDLCSFVIGMFS